MAFHEYGPVIMPDVHLDDWPKINGLYHKVVTLAPTVWCDA
jgi:hypothetical protein